MINAWAKAIESKRSTFSVRRFWQSESGDWILDTTYYFRPDGTLAKEDERLDTFYGNELVLGTAFQLRVSDLPFIALLKGCPKLPLR